MRDAVTPTEAVRSVNSDHAKIFVEWLEHADLKRIRNLDELFATIAIQIADIEAQFVKIVRSVLAHPKFQQLESSFRSIYELINSATADAGDVRNMPPARRVNVFVLDISAQELQSDLTANSYRQTWIYDKLFRKRFDLLIGEQNVDIEGYSAVYPFSLMVVDFDFALGEPERNAADRMAPKLDQIDLPAVRKLAKVGEECFCMFMMSLSPRFFGESFTTFSQLENVIDVHSILRGARYQAWNDFRRQEDSRMIGVTMPRVLIRKPYKNHVMGRTLDHDENVERATGIVFSEFDGCPTAEKMLWGRSSFAVVQPILRSFKQYDWFSDVSGIDRKFDSIPTNNDEYEPGYDGGLIDQYPQLHFETDSPLVANYSPAEIIISEADEAAYSSIGLIPVFSINQSPYIAALSSQSVQQPRDFSTEESSANLRLSSMFNYMMCICRMAHRLKIECRSQIGKSDNAEAIQDHMQRWLMEHSSGRNRGLEQKMIKPFLDEQTGFYVFEDVTDPGRYDCTIRLCPHHKYDNGNVRLVFEPVALRMQLNADEGSS
ncbi:MAG: type VI secretion system contractile sheath large subunit [Planctomycetota bacterium]